MYTNDCPSATFELIEFWFTEDNLPDAFREFLAKKANYINFYDIVNHLRDVTLNEENVNRQTKAFAAARDKRADKIVQNRFRYLG